MPTAPATPKASSTDSGETTVAQFSVRAISAAATTPRMIPATPPASEMATASARNCRMTSRARAPTARRRPISRVRSVTESSVMFMMPMPPTTSDTAATAASSHVIVRLARSSAGARCSSVTFLSSATLPATALATLGGRPPVVSALVAWVSTVKSSGWSSPMPWRWRSSVVMSRASRVTSPDEAAVTVMSLSFDRFSSRCVVVWACRRRRTGRRRAPAGRPRWRW